MRVYYQANLRETLLSTIIIIKIDAGFELLLHEKMVLIKCEQSFQTRFIIFFFN